MPTLYFKPGANNFWETVGNWFTNANGTGAAVDIPWTDDNLYSSYDLAFATGVTTQPRTGGENCQAFGLGPITGTCSIPFSIGYYDGDNWQGMTIYYGNYTAALALNSGSIQGGTFQSSVTGSQESTTITDGTFNGTVTTNGSTISDGTFNGPVIQNEGSQITGGTFNGAFTYVSGTVTGGTFNNGIINQFYRNGFPPPIAFGGYNPNALDVLGTGMV